LSVWHTDTDAVDHGQWIHGHVYPRRADVSADGSLLIAFIRGNAARPRPTQRADTWIAISRPPYFTALALWWVGGTYCAGGMFPDRRSVWIGGLQAPDQGTLPVWLKPASSLPHLDRTQNWTNRTVFHNRLLRDGWLRVADAPGDVWERRHRGHPGTLLLTELGWDPRAHGAHLVHYALRMPDANLQPLHRVTWADWDQHGRLVIVRDGRLLHASDTFDRWIAVADFNPQRPESMPAPAWARRWPRPGPR
jgi:hypothetical protein